MSRTPVLVVTVYRRYYELHKNLQEFQRLAQKLGLLVPVVVVWAAPEVGHLWFFQQLRRDGDIAFWVERPAMAGDGNQQNTTHTESHNLRLGLEEARGSFGQDFYFIVMAADVCPTEAGLRWVHEYMQEPATRACVFIWPNSIVPFGAYHTNFFAVTEDHTYWPPVSVAEHADVLEWQWGRQLLDNALPGIVTAPNPNNKFFVHKHESEGQPLWAVKPQADGVGCGLAIAGYKPWYRRLLEFCGVWRFVRPLRAE